MLYHNLKLAVRNLTRNRSFSFINITGLAIGLACCITIGLYVFNEFSFDRFHKQHKIIYRVNKVTNEREGKAQQDGITPGKLATALPVEIPDVVAATRFRPWFNEMMVSYDTTRIKLDDVVYADNSFLEIFDFPLIKGNRKQVLAEPYTAVLTESTAKKYFGKEDPVGKTMTTLDGIQVKISGISKNVPVNSSIRFNMLISWETITAPAVKDNFSWMNNWTTQVVFTFLQLKEGADPGKVGEKISALMHKYKDETEFQFRPFLQSLDDIHLGSTGINYADQFRTNNSRIIYSLLATAAFILLIACFNFINLITAGSLARAKETGVQKVLGARQSQLVGKFFSESFLLCLVSLVIALMLTLILLPWFNVITDVQLSIQTLLVPEVFISLVGLLILIGVIAGIYPSIFLARFKSSDVFRNIIKAGKDSWLRKTLVTVQFALSILLIIATIVVNRQMNYIVTKDLGFEREQVVVVPLTNTGMEAKSRQLINAIQKYPGIESVSVSNRVPGQSLNGYGIVPEGRRQEEHLLSNVLETDADFLSVFNMEMKEGRYFSSRLATDSTDAIVINEAMARYLNWDKPVGKEFEIYEARKGRVIGVIKDFNFASLRETVQPLAIILSNNPLYLSVKITPGAAQQSLGNIRKEWKSLSEAYPFDYFFMDEQLENFYKKDERMLRILGIFAGLAIVIACMGLFGLSVFSARQRTKEVGIRKVLGASAANITILLSNDFVKLVLIAAVVSFPAGWWIMNYWLQDFAYRIDVKWWVFGVAGVLALTIAIMTVSLQAIKAATANPVKSLRTE